ncbi:MAG: hypothetical protein ABMA25_13945 [Ilumatobacteraceae bacterium]
MNAALLAASNGPVWLLIFGPAAGGGVYYGLWNFYRNANKSHSFETETRVEAKPVTGREHKVDEVRGTTKSGIDGNNVSNHRQRVQRVN